MRNEGDFETEARVKFIEFDKKLDYLVESFKSFHVLDKLMTRHTAYFYILGVTLVLFFPALVTWNYNINKDIRELQYKTILLQEQIRYRDIPPPDRNFTPGNFRQSVLEQYTDCLQLRTSMAE